MDESRLLRWWWIVPLVGLVTFAAVRPSAVADLGEQARSPATAPLVIDAGAGRTIDPPAVNGDVLPVLSDAVRPPLPTQWASAGEPVPFGQWWSGLATGPNIPALWAKPLLLRMGDDGRADLSAPTFTTRADGLRDSTITPALFFEFGPDARVSVLDQSPLHVRFSVDSSAASVTITMLQGSPLLEIDGSGSLRLTVPALRGLESGTISNEVQSFSTAAGAWSLASTSALGIEASGDDVVIALGNAGRFVVGPSLQNSDERAAQAILDVASAPLTDTTEVLSVAPDGSVRQTLTVLRAGVSDPGGLWALLPHHIDFADRSAGSLGWLNSVHGRSPVVSGGSLTLNFPAVPIMWGTPVPEDLDGFVLDPASLVETTERPSAAGSYFGGKNAATDALLHDLFSAAGSDELGVAPLDRARDAVFDLVNPDELGTELAWEPFWGSVVVTPPEFGSAEELNDHHLQNGYWVSAAASIVVADPSQQAALQEGIDLLIADYAGAAVVPGLAGLVSDEGVWSAFAGHSWASGVGGFGAGNSLESISESSNAWWAAAKWFLATDRPELAEPFIARLTIESWLTGYEWLPVAEQQSDDADVRPWTGVVWGGKADPTTWFSASNETALGIRLIPLGPQSFSRYPNAEAVDAAEDRWDWCQARGAGCTNEWSNLLDSDAAVAGRPALAPGPDAEPSTTELVSTWWRHVWEASDVADDWTCSPGSIIRRAGDGSLIALVSNPGPRAIAVTCQRFDGASVELEAAARSATTVVLNP